jgi:hypothetical protein
MRSTLPSGNTTRPTRPQPSGTATRGRVPADGSGHAALLTLVRLLTRQTALKAMRTEPSSASNSKERQPFLLPPDIYQPRTTGGRQMERTGVAHFA